MSDKLTDKALDKIILLLAEATGQNPAILRKIVLNDDIEILNTMRENCEGKVLIWTNEEENKL